MSAGPAAAEKILLAHPQPTDHIYHRLSEAFIENLAETTGGTYTVDYHPGGDLGGFEALYEQVMEGVIPMAFTSPDSTLDPRLDVIFMGYLADDWESARTLYGAGGPMEDVLNDIFQEFDVRSLGVVPTGFGGIAMRKGESAVPVNFPEDAAGLKLRVPGLPIARVKYTAMGFSPVPIPFTEVYTAMQLGTVDARAFAPIPEIWQMRDVIGSYIRTNEYFEATYWFVNDSWWSGLPDADRAQIQEAVDRTLADVWDMAIGIDEEYEAKVRDAGIAVVDLTPEQMDKAKQAVRAAEWPYAEESFGADLLARVNEAAGLQ
ncbi:TRAP transporter substrate-binding protein DctP [Celeribacter indicus]|nr:TRAP transporter substrate-binding protein DctP [Celeribacter indicus]